MIEGSKPGKVKVRRAPSPRSSWRRQGAWVYVGEESSGSEATVGSWKKAGWGKGSACVRVNDFDFCFGTPERVGREG